jgi:hypothetical protein
MPRRAPSFLRSLEDVDEHRRVNDQRLHRTDRAPDARDAPRVPPG